MAGMAKGRLGRAALLATATLLGSATLLASPLMAQDMLVVRSDNGAVLEQMGFAAGEEICLEWAHSVTGGAVADCFENRAGKLVLTRSFLHDFAAGLGEVAGRGRLVSAQGGGYWIVGIDEEISGNALPLRVGAPKVGHILRSAAEAVPLSQRAAGQRVWLHLERDAL